MNPHFHAQLVNDPFGDPDLDVAVTFRRRVLLLDLGDLRPLPLRKILTVEAAFFSHTHLDHSRGSGSPDCCRRPGFPRSRE